MDKEPIQTTYERETGKRAFNTISGVDCLSHGYVEWLVNRERALCIQECREVAEAARKEGRNTDELEHYIRVMECLEPFSL